MPWFLNQVAGGQGGQVVKVGVFFYPFFPYVTSSYVRGCGMNSKPPT